MIISLAPRNDWSDQRYHLSQPHKTKTVMKISFLVCGEFAFAHEYVLALRLAIWKRGTSFGTTTPLYYLVFPFLKVCIELHMLDMVHFFSCEEYGTGCMNSVSYIRTIWFKNWHRHARAEINWPTCLDRNKGITELVHTESILLGKEWRIQAPKNTI
jgi:hypothetical protein